MRFVDLLAVLLLLVVMFSVLLLASGAYRVFEQCWEDRGQENKLPKPRHRYYV